MTDAGAYCERVDEQIYNESILERVYNQISKADIIVADMTGRNPNVFYEVGYAHALNKQVILLTQKKKDIPFDLQHYPHIIYEKRIAYLKDELEKRVRWCIENPRQSLSKGEVALEFLVNGQPLASCQTIRVCSQVIQGRLFTFNLNIDVHNVSGHVVEAESFALSLIDLSNAEIANAQLIHVIGSAEVRSILHNTDGQKIVNLKTFPSMFPDAWESVSVGLGVKCESLESVEKWSMILRQFSQVGTKDYPFELDIVEPELSSKT